MKLAVIGATGLVGTKMLQILEEQQFGIDEFIPVASTRSVGKKIHFCDQRYTIVSMESALESKPDIAIFSAGGETSREWAPKFAAVGTTVIDNSSAWRMKEDIKLVVPEINGHLLGPEDKIIANPNCSTIQMVLALSQLHKRYKIKRLVISTYQSVTGTGVAAVTQLEKERMADYSEKVYPHVIDKNCIPHGGDFDPSGYTTEEIKLVEETRKILGDPSIAITATVVRIPVLGGHSESVNVEFNTAFELNDVIQTLEETSGVTVQDDPINNVYPMPIDAYDKDDVFVGRIRRDESINNGLNLWIVSDNLRKGAATNAVQIAKTVAKALFEVK